MDTTARSKPDFAQVYIVEASAGSGKTYTLAKRYVSLLLNFSRKEEIPLRSILAITFTNKAAFEMKERILELLKKIALDCFSTSGEKEDILNALGGDEQSLREKAHLALEYLIRNYNFFQVQTIDSFINALLSGCAFKLNLSAAFKIKNDYSEYLRYSLDTLIDKAGEEPEIYQLFERFLRQYLHIENRFGWLPKNDILKILEVLLAYTNTYGGNFKKYKGTSESLISQKKEIYAKIAQIGKNMPEGTDKRFQAKVEKIVLENKGLVNVEDVAAFFNRENFPANKGAQVNSEIIALWDDLRKDIRELCEDEAYLLFNCYVEMFALFFAEFKKAAVKDDIVFLSELNRQARMLFDNQFVTVPELYFRLSSRFSNYLIDEFQDTSFLQWKNIFPLIEDGLSSSGTLFYVGDKKQAIYRFRGGDVLLFDQIKKELSAFRQEHLVLSNNFRSRAEIVSFNNNIFSTGNLTRAVNNINEKKSANGIFLDEGDVADIVGFFKDSGQTNRVDKPGGFVSAVNMAGVNDSENGDLIKETLLNTIQDLYQRYNYRDIAILVRSNDEVELCASWLLAAGIPVESDKTLNIREQPLVKELISFLQFLSSPIDNLAFASFIMGDIFLQASGLEKEKIISFLFELGQSRRSGRNIYYYRKFREQFPEIWEKFIADSFKNVGFVPLYELTVSALGSFGVLRNFPEYHGFFMRLLELIHEQEEEHPAIGDFLEFFAQARDEDLYVKIFDANSVRVLTIHKSKGLEFSAVITPFLSLDVEISPDIVYPESNELCLLRLKKDYVKFSPMLAKIYLQEYKKAFIDELNNIYVAFTRARDELHIFVPQKGGRKLNYAQMLFNSLDYHSGSPVERGKEQKIGAESNLLFLTPAEYRNWIPLLKEEYVGVDTLWNQENLIQGEALHAALSFIPAVKDSSLETIIASAVKRAAGLFPEWVDIGDFKTTVSELIGRKSWRRFFFLDQGQVYQERAFITGRGQTKRIDRLIVNDAEVIIVDYKSALTRQEEDLLQMREYLALIKEIYPDKAVKGYFLYFTSPEIEEING